MEEKLVVNLIDAKNQEVIQEREKSKRAKATQEKKQVYIPTWEEVWYTGYMTKTERKKTGILANEKLTELERKRLEEVKIAVDVGEMGLNVPNLARFSKAEALRMWQALYESRKKAIIENMIANTPANYHLIQTGKQFDKLLYDLGNEDIFAIDTETTGVDVFTDEMVGISFSLPKADYHVYIPFGHTISDKQLKRDYVLYGLAPILSNSKIGKVLHNARFDVQMFKRHGYELNGVVHDTLIAMTLLNENEDSYALKNLATKYGKFFGFDYPSHTYEELFGCGGFEGTPLDIALCYAAKDTHLTWELYKWQIQHLKQVGKLNELYSKIENPLIEVVIEMEQTGFLIDMDFAKEYGEELKDDIRKLETGLFESFGEINLNSVPQLQKALYDDLQLPDMNKRKTDVKTLKSLVGEHPAITDLLKYRELTKLSGTYIDKLPEITKGDGRVHGSFNQVATHTGRFSSNNPNLQNLPPRARLLFIAPDGKLIIGTDFSQIEPRILAHISGDLKLREPYLTGQDLYSTLASQVFKVPLSECGDGSKYRKMMKTGLLAVMYGTSMFTLSQQLGITVEEAYQFIQDFYKTYPDVHRFIKSVHELAKNQEYVETMFGRKRRFPGHREKAIQYDKLAKEICQKLGFTDVPYDFWKYKELPYKLKRAFQDVKGDVESIRRQAVNAIIQGSAADIMKMALIYLYHFCKGKGWNVLGTVHDEALLLVDNTITLAEVEELENCMTKTVSLSVPLKCDTELTTRWGEGQKKNEYFKAA